MGARSQTETVAGIYQSFQSFLQRRTWSQAALAKELDVSVGTLRRVFGELQAGGMPLHRDEDHPQVYWSVPKDWYPGSVLFKRDEVPKLLRQLRRVPQGAGRREVLDLVVARLPGVEADAPGVTTRTPSVQEEQYLSVVEDSIARVALRMKYYTASRGDVGERHAPVHRVHAGPPNNLLPGMRGETLAGGERITLETTALGRLARFVVALGAAATPETPSLAAAVADLARGALAVEASAGKRGFPVAVGAIFPREEPT